eukprot:GILI01017968.1.p1 GENE.GILI01017968.1~~GILI01017968.1.p1  ORF type:complete len:360 (-),score=18.63 GILI01017968.1:180-1259(-)
MRNSFSSPHSKSRPIGSPPTPTPHLFVGSPASQRHTAFDVADILEQGLAREYTSACLRVPSYGKKLRQCYVVRSDDRKKFCLYLEEDDSFQLQACIEDNKDIYFSLYHPDEEPAHKSYCAVLRQVGERQFHLFSRDCEGCDQRWYSCGCPEREIDRQELAFISHSMRHYDEISLNYMDIVIPSITPDGSRVVWCPRNCPNTSLSRIKPPVSAASTPNVGSTPRSSNFSTTKSNFYPGSGSAPSSGTSTPTTSLATTAPSSLPTIPSYMPSGSSSNRDDVLFIRSKIPQWNDRLESLVLDFRGRVTQGSAKNFQLCMDSRPDRVILQYGKCGDEKFILDYRYPLSMLQAFAVAMSSWKWI